MASQGKQQVVKATKADLDKKEEKKSEAADVKSCYVVYVYVNYRKEIGTRVLRTYLNRDEALAFAKSMSTEYKKEKEGDAKEGAENEDDEDDGDDEEYAIVKGTEFDEKFKLPKEKWHLYNFNMEGDDRHLWCLRVAVDKCPLF